MPRSRSRSRSRTPQEDLQPLPAGAKRISESDYFLKSDEFRVWLKDEKDRYMDELSTDKARKYFKKFVKAWNRGELASRLYSGVDSDTVRSHQTGYKWSFVEREGGKADRDAMKRVREAVASDSHGPSPSSSSSTRVLGPALPPGTAGRMQGPSMPSASDLQSAREDAAELDGRDRQSSRKRARQEERDRVEDAVGPREVGREAMLANKRAKRDADRSFRNAKEDGDEVDADTLMGGDSFQAALAKRDAAKSRYADKAGSAREERDMANRERRDALREKDRATMDMFKAMAKERFG
ncbi:hypothetical protein BKA62DRAFT_424946 [Auriculariales sp. MPI-PUGE-AT-0066]|nr:hypothetical protein BKA62DRAFT_424946 [Auriculariales sp. MPI-PUGE-AT-0066]